MIKELALTLPPLRRLQEDRIRLRATVDDLRRTTEDLRETVGSLNGSVAEREKTIAELKARSVIEASPFVHYHSPFDLRALISRHENPNRAPKLGHVVNYLGVALNTDFVPVIAHLAGTVEGVPIPANWHADIAEWGAALRALELSKDTFTMAELGCGWGCWMNITGTAAKRLELKTHLIGVEGDEGHITFAKQAFATNNIPEEDYTLIRGIATAASGIALFPRQNEAGSSWGLEPIFNASDQQRAEAIASGAADELPMISLAEVIGIHPKLDLLHIDIQGGEAALIRDCLPLLSERVAYIVVGTHSRQIEGQIMGDLLSAGWHLEVERPAILMIHEHRPVVTVDGVQGWRNPRLCPL
jgi:hypothetical protein